MKFFFILSLCKVFYNYWKINLYMVEVNRNDLIIFVGFFIKIFCLFCKLMYNIELKY